MLAELWGFKKWCTAWRRLFGRVLSWWIWFCQTSLRNVLFIYFFGKWESTKQIAMYSRTQEKWVVIRRWHVAGGWVIYPELGSWNPKINFLLRHWAGTEEERVREPWLESVQISADESISVAQEAFSLFFLNAETSQRGPRAEKVRTQDYYRLLNRKSQCCASWPFSKSSKICLCRLKRTMWCLQFLIIAGVLKHFPFMKELQKHKFLFKVSNCWN